MLNSVLPSDIRILSWSPVDITFSSRFDCKCRCYKYLFYKNGMNIDNMKKACQLLKGTHDFRNFCKMDVVNVNNFVREIIDIDIARMTDIEQNGECKQDDLDELWCIDIKGTAFLWHQIRFMMTVLFMIGSGKESFNVINDLLDIQKCDGKPQYNTASDIPLILYDCEFDESKVKFKYYRFKAQLMDTFTIWHQSWRQQQIACDVRKIFWRKCLHGIKGELDIMDGKEEKQDIEHELNKLYQELNQLNLPGSKKKNKRQRPIQHVMLMNRQKELSYQQRVDRMGNSKLRKYNEKQKQREFFQNND